METEEEKENGETNSGGVVVGVVGGWAASRARAAVLGGIYCPYLVGSLGVVWQLVIHGAINGAVADDGCEERALLAALRFAEADFPSEPRAV